MNFSLTASAVIPAALALFQDYKKENYEVV